jgi:NAD+ diphosphatase
MPKDHFPTQILKFCPRCGSDFFGSEDHKLMKCGRCGFEIYFNVSASVAALIFNNEGELLFTVRKRDPAKGMLDLPGGFVDNDETVEEALIREIKEELDLDIVEYKYVISIPNIYLYEGLTYRTIDLFFECKVKSLERIKPNDDVSGYIFIKPEAGKTDQIGLLSIKKLMEKYYA